MSRPGSYSIPSCTAARSDLISASNENANISPARYHCFTVPMTARYAFRALRALVLGVWLYSSLLCAYTMARVILNPSQVDITDAFFNDIPSLSFYDVSVLSFAICVLCVVVSLILWRVDMKRGALGERAEGARPGPLYRGMVLGTWLLSTTGWFLVIARILSGGCSCDIFAPLISGVPFLTLVTAGMITFVLSFVSMALYFTLWWPLDEAVKPAA